MGTGGRMRSGGAWIKPCAAIGLWLLLSIWEGPAEASAWLAPKGHFQSIITVRSFRNGDGFDDQGLAVAATKFQKFEIDAYTEYGLTRAITLGLTPRYQVARAGQGASAARNNGPGDLDAFVRLHLADFRAWTSSAQFAVKTPLYGRMHQPAAGNARKEFEARLAAGRNITILRLPTFIDGEVAYRLGTQGVADQLRLEGAAGVSLFPRLKVLLKGYRTQSIGDGDGRPDSRFDLYKLEASLLLRATRNISVEFGAGKEASDLAQGLGTSFFGALWLRF